MMDFRVSKTALFESMLINQGKFVHKNLHPGSKKAFRETLESITLVCKSNNNLADCQFSINRIRDRIPASAWSFLGGRDAKFHGASLACTVALDIIHSLNERFPNET